MCTFANMKKQRLHIERELHSSSAPIIWDLISTAHGLSRWLADDIQEQDNTLIFTWGNPYDHHETRTATVIERSKFSVFRMRWNDDTDEDIFMELRMDKNDLTNDYILSITDFATAEDIDALSDIWEDNLIRLHHSSGL